jgi:hypothetical protein
MFDRIRNLLHNIAVLTATPIQLPRRPPAAAAPAPAAPQVAAAPPAVEVPLHQADPSCKPATVVGLLKSVLEHALTERKIRWQGWEAPVEEGDVDLLKMSLAYVQRVWTMPRSLDGSLPLDQPLIDMASGKRTSLREMTADAAARSAVRPITRLPDDLNELTPVNIDEFAPSK